MLTGIERQAAEMGYSIFLDLIHQPATDEVDHLLNHLFARQQDSVHPTVALLEPELIVRTSRRSPAPSRV